MDYLPIVAVVFSIISLILMLFLWKRLEEKTLSKLNVLGSELNSGLETIYEDLDPIIKANSRAMGAISSLSDDTKQDKAIERRLGQDLIAQNEDVVEIIRMAFPRVSEYIDDHPEAVTKLMPRLNTLLSDPEARKRLNLGTFSGSDL
ncbi:unnamed protein product, partial [marine sediment metagenome]